jgi:hypothetical protein
MKVFLEEEDRTCGAFAFKFALNLMSNIYVLDLWFLGKVCKSFKIYILTASVRDFL